MKRVIKQILAASLIGGICALVNMMPIARIPAYAKTSLEAPSGAFWGNKKGDDEGYYAHWDEVEEAKKYEVYVYYINDNDGYTKVGSLTTSKNYASLVTKFTKTADYVFRVRAVGSGDYSTSSWSEYSDEVYYEKESETKTNTGTNAATGVNALAGGPGATGTSPTAGWRQYQGRWWYATNADGTTWYANCWKWIDGYCYCFDANGYMYANTVTPDGYVVNADGQWMQNGIIQKQ